MANNIFKSIFAIIGIGLVSVLYQISLKIESPRYLSNTAAGISIVDTKTGKVYVYRPDSENWALIDKDGKYIEGAKIPSN